MMGMQNLMAEAQEMAANNPEMAARMMEGMDADDVAPDLSLSSDPNSGHVGGDHEKWMNKISIQYINNCTDTDELLKIIDAMHEGGFVGLHRAAEDKLVTVQKRTEQSTDTDALFDDLFSWESEARSQDEELKTLRTGAASGSAPVRRGAMKVEPKQIPREEPKAAPKEVAEPDGNSARHTYDNYQSKWDKWDNAKYIDEVLEQEEAKMDEADQVRPPAARRRGSKRQSLSDHSGVADRSQLRHRPPQLKADKIRDTPAAPRVSEIVRNAPVEKPMTSVEKKYMADKEKEKGNGAGPSQHGLPSKTLARITSACGATRPPRIKRPASPRVVRPSECFKSGELDTAVEYYTRALSLHKDHMIYSNRAMAYLRLKRCVLCSCSTYGLSSNMMA